MFIRCLVVRIPTCHRLGMGDIDIMAYDYCEVSISQLSDYWIHCTVWPKNLTGNLIWQFDIHYTYYQINICQHEFSGHCACCHFVKLKFVIFLKCNLEAFRRINNIPIIFWPYSICIENVYKCVKLSLNVSQHSKTYHSKCWLSQHTIIASHDLIYC